ncbi:MAG: MarR family transcriptional regulator, partial [Planctomycetota bacterium]|nr:MarR family transcriptional regulator [Planctomycetota bacterium]
VTRLLDRLESAELVSRERGKNDRRIVVTRITRKGLAILAKLDEPTIDRHAELLGHLDEPELQELIRLLEKARDGSTEPTA